MIRAYTYCATCHTTLHDSIIAFFNRIQFETDAFRDELFDAQLLDLANRHQTILKSKLESIYNRLRTWTQPERTALCEEIRRSNDIESICNGTYTPRIIDRTATGIDAEIRALFLNLYKQVLDGVPFRERHSTSLMDHFITFSNTNREITLCPICGISELKKHHDDSRDQYDHYLPESKYPFSAVNFINLVPGCTECNSPQVKGSKDVVRISKGHLFYPYDTTHKGISIQIAVKKDDQDIEKVEWKITYSNPNGKADEIEAWKSIYKIESRYQGYIKPRVKKWFKSRYEAKRNSINKGVSEPDFEIVFDSMLDADQENQINFIRKPAIKGFLTGSSLAQAELEARFYSN